jgi:sensor histidine kinase regulating citrate/malate metabolism
MVVWYFQIRSMLKKTVSPFLNEKCKDYWKTVWFIPLFLYIAMSIVLPLDENLESFSVLLSRLFISISLIIFARVFSSHNRIIMEKQTLEEELNRSKIHYAEMQSYVEAARKTRHDLKHILNAVRHFIDTNDKSGLSEFCYTVEETQLCDTNVPHTGCSAVDGVLYHYIKRSEASDIRFSYKGNFAHTGISDMDLCGMIGNALENALQAIAQSEEIYIVTGVTFNKVGENKNINYATPKDDSSQKCAIPNYFYKVVLKVNKSGGTVTSASTIGFWFVHQDYTGQDYAAYAVSVDQIEQWTGMDFFVNLPDNVETAAETNTNWISFQNF